MSREELNADLQWLLNKYRDGDEAQRLAAKSAVVVMGAISSAESVHRLYDTLDTYTLAELERLSRILGDKS